MCILLAAVFLPHSPKPRRSTALEMIKVASMMYSYLLPTHAFQNSWFHPKKITKFLFLKSLKLQTAVKLSSYGILGFQQRKDLLHFETLNDFSFRRH